MLETISITAERYEQLIRAEHDANCLKALIIDKCAKYSEISYEEVTVLFAMYHGNKED